MESKGKNGPAKFQINPANGHSSEDDSDENSKQDQ